MRGRWYEEFRRGETWRSPGRRISRRDIRAFAGLSGDHNPLHIDSLYARRGPFKGPIAHGLLGLAVASGLLDRLGIVRETVLAFVGMDWRFVRPIRSGDTLRVNLRVLAKRKTGQSDRGLVTLASVIVNQKGKPVQEGRWTLLVHRRPGASSD